MSARLDSEPGEVSWRTLCVMNGQSQGWRASTQYHLPCFPDHYLANLPGLCSGQHKCYLEVEICPGEHNAL